MNGFLESVGQHNLFSGYVSGHVALPFLTGVSTVKSSNKGYPKLQMRQIFFALLAKEEVLPFASLPNCICASDLIEPVHSAHLLSVLLDSKRTTNNYFTVAFWVKQYFFIILPQNKSDIILYTSL